MKKRLIIIQGTGRCGSLYTANFINQQKSVRCLHEGGPADKFYRYRALQVLGLAPVYQCKNDWLRIQQHLAKLWESSGHEQIVADTGMYFLPYTQEIMGSYPSVKIVCLQRNQDAVIHSYLERTRGFDPWNKDDPAGFHIGKTWSGYYPNMPGATKAERIAHYWESYYESAKVLENDFPDQYQIFHTEKLNSVRTKIDILDFIGIQGKDMVIPCKGEHNTTPTIIKKALSFLG